MDRFNPAILARSLESDVHAVMVRHPDSDQTRTRRWLHVGATSTRFATPATRTEDFVVTRANLAEVVDMTRMGLPAMRRRAALMHAGATSGEPVGPLEVLDWFTQRFGADSRDYTVTVRRGDHEVDFWGNGDANLTHLTPDGKFGSGHLHRVDRGFGPIGRDEVLQWLGRG